MLLIVYNVNKCKCENIDEEKKQTSVQYDIDCDLLCVRKPWGCVQKGTPAAILAAEVAVSLLDKSWFSSFFLFYWRVPHYLFPFIQSWTWF